MACCSARADSGGRPEWAAQAHHRSRRCRYAPPPSAVSFAAVRPSASRNFESDTALRWTLQDKEKWWSTAALGSRFLTVRLWWIMAEVRHTYCDQCGHKSGFTRFCPHCGAPGTDRPYTPSVPRPGYCPGCGEEYSTVTSKYCSVCGVPRSVGLPDNAEPHCCSCGKQIATASSEYCSHCGGKVLHR